MRRGAERPQTGGYKINLHFRRSVGRASTEPDCSRLIYSKQRLRHPRYDRLNGLNPDLRISPCTFTMDHNAICL